MKKFLTLALFVGLFVPAVANQDVNIDLSKMFFNVAQGKTGLNDYLKNGGTINDRTEKSGCYLLHSAVWNHNAILVGLLLGKGASALVKDVNEDTPLDIAQKLNAENPSPDLEKIIELLRHAISPEVMISTAKAVAEATKE